jgi:hypothetical protein
VNAHDLEFIATNVEISASLVGRMMSGKTRCDYLNWEHKLNEDPIFELLVLQMEELDA